MESSKFPFRYDIKLENVPNINIDDKEPYKDLSKILSYINGVASDLVIDINLNSNEYLLELDDASNVIKLKSYIDSVVVDMKMSDKRDDYYIIVNPQGKSVQLINSNDLETDLKLPSEYASNMTVFIYKKLSPTETTLVRRIDTMYGVQEGSFDDSDFAGIDFSIGSFK